MYIKKNEKIAKVERLKTGVVSIETSDEKKYILCADQKIKYIFFPHLLWQQPVKIIETDKEEISKIANHVDDPKGAILAATALCWPAEKILTWISNNVYFYSPVSTSMYGVAVLFIAAILRIIFRNNKRVKLKNEKNTTYCLFKPVKMKSKLRAIGICLFLIMFLIILCDFACAPFMKGNIAVLVICGMVYATLYYNLGFVDVGKAQITFLD